jgi:acyl phosphate:glycerol-3-phosphate acyltransferase
VSLLTIVLLGVAGYVLGSLPWGYWLSRFFTGKDIREVGSRGTGAANVWRHAGFKMFFAVALLDIGKGSAAAALGLVVGGGSGAVVAGTGALIGHWRPLFLGFKRGGKIVATTVGVALVIAPVASVVMAVLWWMVLLATRYTSVASITASLALPPLVLVFGGSWPEVLFTVGAAAAIIVLHRANIERLMRGTENRFTIRLPGLHRRSPAPVAAAAASDPTPPVR